ncbi:MAG: hypothetical protein JW384_03971 [Nitrosomonadaceae bacterium]|nr:hypothetical protein [Nitrosomonadaceae bacterium]
MAITSTQSKTSASITNIAVGRYLDTGTAAAFTITTGFQPRYVRVINLDGSGGKEEYEWFEGMTAAHAFKRVAAGTATVITSLGITVSATGFTVGLDTDINVTSEQISWMAMG